MKNRKISLVMILISSFIIFNSCTSKINDKTINLIGFKKINSYEIPLDTFMFRFPLKLRYSDDYNSIQFSGNERAIIYEYHLNEKLLDKKIFSHFKGKYYIQNWEFVNDSFVILGFSNVYLGGVHDSCLVAYNPVKDKVLYYYDMSGLPNTLLLKNIGKLHNGNSNYIYLNQFPLKIQPDSSVVIGFGSTIRSYDSLYRKVGQSHVVKIYPSFSKHKIHDFGVYFENPQNMYYPGSSHTPVGCYNDKNELLVSFGHSNDITKISLHNSIHNKQFIRQALELPSSAGVVTEQMINDKILIEDQVEYLELKYNELTNQYYRVLRLPIDSGSAFQANFPQHCVIVMDSVFNTIGVVKFPLGYTAPIIPSPNGLLAFNRLASLQNKTIILDEFEVIYNNTPIDVKELFRADQSNSQDKTSHFLSSIDKKLTKYKTIVVIPLSTGCEMCIDQLGSILRNDKTNTSYAKIFIGGSIVDLEMYLKKYELDLNESFFIDGEQYLHHFNDDTKIYLLTKEGHDYTETAIAPDNFDVLYSTLSP